MSMAHESLVSYYSNNFSLLFHKDIGYVNRFTVSDLDNMLPYEREIYMFMINQKLEEHNKKAGNPS